MVYSLEQTNFNELLLINMYTHTYTYRGKKNYFGDKIPPEICANLVANYKKRLTSVIANKY